MSDEEEEDDEELSGEEPGLPGHGESKLIKSSLGFDGCLFASGHFLPSLLSWGSRDPSQEAFGQFLTVFSLQAFEASCLQDQAYHQWHYTVLLHQDYL